MKHSTFKKIALTVLVVTGYGLLFWANWKIGLGVLIVIWANNLEFDLKRKVNVFK